MVEHENGASTKQLFGPELAPHWQRSTYGFLARRRGVVYTWTIALLSLAGALVYAELAAMMPSAGGEYVFIRDAYGRVWGFLYGWTRFFVASAGGLAGLAAGFAIFLNVIAGGVFGTRVTTLAVLGYHLDVSGLQVMAIASIAVVTAINCAAITVGGRKLLLAIRRGQRNDRA